MLTQLNERSQIAVKNIIENIASSVSFIYLY